MGKNRFFFVYFFSKFIHYWRLSLSHLECHPDFLTEQLILRNLDSVEIYISCSVHKCELRGNIDPLYWTDRSEYWDPEGRHPEAGDGAAERHSNTQVHVPYSIWRAWSYSEETERHDLMFVQINLGHFDSANCNAWIDIFFIKNQLIWNLFENKPVFNYWGDESIPWTLSLDPPPITHTSNNRIDLFHPN